MCNILIITYYLYIMYSFFYKILNKFSKKIIKNKMPTFFTNETNYMMKFVFFKEMYNSFKNYVKVLFLVGQNYTISYK